MRQEVEWLSCANPPPRDKDTATNLLPRHPYNVSNCTPDDGKNEDKESRSKYTGEILNPINFDDDERFFYIKQIRVRVRVIQ